MSNALYFTISFKNADYSYEITILNSLLRLTYNYDDVTVNISH